MVRVPSQSGRTRSNQEAEELAVDFLFDDFLEER